MDVEEADDMPDANPPQIPMIMVWIWTVNMQGGKVSSIIQPCSISGPAAVTLRRFYWCIA